MNPSADAFPPTDSPSVATVPNRNAPRQRGVRSSLALVAIGVALIVCAALIDAQEAKEAPWVGAILSPQGDAPWEGTIPIRARRLPLKNYPIREQADRLLRRWVSPEARQTFGLTRTELLVAVYAPVETLEPLLASGRLPRPGYPEVLAGAFANLTEIYADDAHLEVVGRLKRTTGGGLARAYVMPADEVWEPFFEVTMRWGWLDPAGREKLLSLDDARALDEDMELYGGLNPASAASTWLSFLGLVLAAVGGAGLHRAAFGLVRGGVFAPACHAFGEHPKLVRAMHVGLYGVFFSAMLLAVLVPQINALVIEYVMHVFTDGGLGYVGSAYASGNVLAAAAATWMNNYVVQTVLFTVLASLVVPCIGVLKTMASFGLVGLGMAPIWSGIATNYTFHSITMVLELEAYIYACSAVVIFWKRAIASMQRREREPLIEGVRVLVSATLLAGVMLAIAGLYEATTLILLR